MDWEKVQIASETGDEWDGKDVNVEVEGSNSNGHGKEKDKEGHIMKIIEGLQREAQAHQADSQNLMKVRDRHSVLNLKFFKSLERIDRKLEKGRDSSKTESHRTPGRRRRSRRVRTDERKRRLRSGSRHLSHSQRHSSRGTRSILSSSPTRKHQKSGRDELKGEINKIKLPTFDGEHKKEEDAEIWLLGIKKYFQLQNYSTHAEGRIAMYQLKGKASMWWDQLVQVQHIREKELTWKKFKMYFEKKYLTKIYYDRNMKEFFELKLGSMTIDEYEQSFMELLKYVPFIKNEAVKIQRYLSGLPLSIGDKIQYDDPKTVEETIRREKCLYEQQRENPTFRKAWNDQRGLKKNRGRRETGHPFSRISLGDSHLLETPRKLKGVRRCQGLHLWSVGAVKGIIGTETAPTEKTKQELFILLTKLK
jgi:hypothetical protein